MSTFLELCQSVAVESGTVPTIGEPLTVTGQTDPRLYRVVRWTREAWRQIQTSESHWRWMRGEFSGTTTSGTQRYLASDLGISTRFGQWILPDAPEYVDMTYYKTSTGQSGEQRMSYKPWNEFYRECLVGSVASNTGAPQIFTVTPDNKLAFYPIPDDTYTIRGQYMKSEQILAADTDEPEMPSQFHPLIEWLALGLLATFDESVVQKPMWKDYEEQYWGRLNRHQKVMKIGVGAPLA